MGGRSQIIVHTRRNGLPLLITSSSASIMKEKIKQLTLRRRNTSASAFLYRFPFLTMLLLLLLLASSAIIFYRARIPAKNSPVAISEKQGRKHVLLIASYHTTHLWTEELVRSIRQAARSLPWELDFNVIEFDALRIHDPEVWQKKISYEFPRFAAGDYDLVITLDNEALDVLLKDYNKLPPNLPIVFAGYETYVPELKKRYPNMTGLIQDFNLRGNVQTGLRLWPDTRNIMILANVSEFGPQLNAMQRETLPTLPGVDIQYLNDGGLSRTEIFEAVQQMPAASFLVVNPWRGLSNNDYQTLSAFGVDLARQISRPFLVSADSLIGYGALGGYVTIASIHGRELVNLLARVLAAGSAKDIPVEKGSLVPLFDYRLMKKYHLDFSALPPGSQFVNAPLPLWETHLPYLLTGGAFLLFSLLSLIGGLIYFIRYRRMTRQNLALFALLPVRTGVIDRAENLLYVHGEMPEDSVSGTPRKLAALIGIDYPKISAAMDKVFAEKKPISLEYEYRDKMRVMRIAPLPSEMHGKEALIWISHDNTELKQSRLQALILSKENKKTLTRLQDATRLWDIVINAVPFYFFVKDADHEFRYTLVNEAFARFVNKPREQIIGKTDAEIFAMASDAAHFGYMDKPIVQNNLGREISEQATDGLGAIHQLQTIKKPFTTVDGKRLLLGAALDVTQTHNLIESERITNEALSQVALENDFSRCMELVLPVLARQLHCDGAAIAQYDHDQRQYRILHEWIGPNVSSIRQLDPSELAELLGSGHEDYWYNRIFAIPDTGIHSQGAAWANRGTQSIIGAPVFIENRLWGILLVGFKKYKRLFSEVDEGIMRSMAHIVGLTLVRSRQTEAMQLANREKQLILNNIKIPVWLYDADGQLIRINTAVCDITGISEPDLLTDYDRLAPELPPVLPWMTVRETGRSAHQEITFRQRDYLVKAEPIHDAKGNLINIVQSAVDVTILNELAENEKVINVCLEELMNENDFEGAIQRTMCAICSHLHANRCYIIKYHGAENAVEFLYDYASTEVSISLKKEQPQPLDATTIWYQRMLDKELIVYPDTQLPEVQKELGPWMELVNRYGVRSIFSAGIYINGELWGNLGMTYDAETHTLTDQNLKFLRAAAHMFELILERKRSREQLLSALQQAEDANRAKSFFLASMSHEIRTPLNAVIGFSDLLKDETLDRQVQRDYLNSISNSGNALLQLINDVLDLSKLEADQMAFNPEETNFAELCHEVGDIFQPQMKAKSLTGTIDIPHLPFLFVDKLRIRQILFNLIGNAVKFTQTGGWTLRATFEPRPADCGTLRFSVSDTGAGIDKADQKALFDLFVQTKNFRGTYAANSGTGLGLVICRRMLQRMNGKITLESELGKGSTFTVILEKVAFAEKQSLTPGQAQARPMTDKTTPFVLLVDDIEINLKVMQAIMQKMEIRSITASSGQEALKLLGPHSFDMVFTDLWMPEMNGEQLAKAIRQVKGCESIPIVAVTADVASGDNFDISCFTHIITKPVTAGKLRDILKSMPRPANAP